jgi:hypothetical protein
MKTLPYDVLLASTNGRRFRLVGAGFTPALTGGAVVGGVKSASEHWSLLLPLTLPLGARACVPGYRPSGPPLATQRR